MKYTIKMVTDKATKGTIRYAEVTEPGKPPVIKTLYIQKWALSDPAPPDITITIEDARLPSKASRKSV